MPWIQHPNTDRFLDLLAQLDFATTYYNLVDREPLAGPAFVDTPEAHLALLRGLGETPEYLPAERAYEVYRDDAPLRSRMTLLFRPGELQLGLLVKTPQGELGGTAPTLALQVAQRRDKAFTRSPPYPAIPCVSLSDQRAVLTSGLELFRNLHSAVKAAAKTWA